MSLIEEKMNFKSIILLLLSIILISCSNKQQSTIPTNSFEGGWSLDELEANEKIWDSIYTSIPLKEITKADIDILRKLFYLSVDGRNPKINYTKSYSYGELLSILDPNVSNELYSWIAVLTELKRENSSKNALLKFMSEKNDSCNTLISKLKSENSKIRKKLSSENATINSLRDSLKTQKEIVEKLKEIDIETELDRQKFN